MELQDVKTEISFQFAYNKWTYFKKLISAIFSGVFSIGIFGINLLFYHIYDGINEKLSNFCLLAAIIIAFCGYFLTTDTWKKFNHYSIEIAFFKKWEKEIGLCGIGQKANEIYIFFDIGKQQKICKQTLEFLTTYHIVGPIIYMQTFCNKYPVNKINGIVIHDGSSVEFLVTKEKNI